MLGLGFAIWEEGSAKKKSCPTNFLFLLAVIIVSLFWSLTSGSGGYGFQNRDWIKHNLILSDLISHSWPVYYLFAGENRPLVYSFAFYLPAALVGKSFGWYAANKALFITTWFGACLSLFWVTVFFERRRFWAAFLFVFFGGLDLLGRVIISDLINFGTSNFEGWTETWQYHSNSHQLAWNPQHSLVAWIAMGLLMNEFFFKKTTRNTLFYLALCSLWSPFVVIGLIPFFFIGIYERKAHQFQSVQNLVVAPLLFLAGVLFLGSNAFAFHRSWIYQRYNVFEIVLILFLFYLLEFLIYILFCRDWSVCSEKKSRLWILTTVVILFLCPLYSIGFWNDFTMRVSIPSLFVLSILVIRNILLRPLDGFTKGLLVFFIVGAFTGFSEIARSLRNPTGMPRKMVERSLASQPNRAAWQYVGSLNTFFFKNLSKKT